MKEAKKVTTESVKKLVVVDDFQEQKPKINELKFNAASSSRGKENIIDDNEEDEPDEHESKQRKAREAEIDETNHIVREAEEKARLAREAKDTLKSQKTIFPLWTIERILKEAIENPDVYWLDPVGYFNLENSLDLQLDLPITPKDFLFRSFDLIANASPGDKVLIGRYVRFILST